MLCPEEDYSAIKWAQSITHLHALLLLMEKFKLLCEYHFAFQRIFSTFRS